MYRFIQGILAPTLRNEIDILIKMNNRQLEMIQELKEKNKQYKAKINHYRKLLKNQEES